MRIRSFVRPSRRPALLAAGALAAAGALLAVAAEGGRTTHLDCSVGPVTVTASITLDGDMTCPNDAFVIAADGVTIDFDGHKVDGDNGAGDYGIDNPGYDGLTIKDGELTEFDIPVLVTADAQKTTITGMRILFSGTDCVDLNEADFVKVDKTLISGCGQDGIVIQAGSTGGVFQNSTFVSVFGTGLRLDGAGHKVQKNRFTQGSRSIVVDGTGHTVTGNSVFQDRSDGIDVVKGPNTISKNTVIGSDGYGIYVHGAAATDVVVDGNTVTGNAQAGIAVDLGAPNVVVSKNKATANSTDGIVVVSGPNALVTGNTATGNQARGVEVQSGTASKNTATANGERGIYIWSTGVNGGGNKGSDNGDTDCFGCA